MIDESKHRYWKGILVACPRCDHKMSIEDYNAWKGMCPFCGKLVVKMPEYEEVEVGYREINTNESGRGDKGFEAADCYDA